MLARNIESTSPFSSWPIFSAQPQSGRKVMMRKFIACFALLIFTWAATSLSAPGQNPRKVSRRPSEPPTQAQPEPTPPDQVETVKIDTSLVTIPVVVTDAGGLFVADLRQDEVNIFEDGVKQEVAFFATVSMPFQVILMLDTSASTEGKLRQIREAALAFLDQLKPADKVKVISFDNVVHDLNDFTSDRQILRSAINKTNSGQGTKLYDAFELALSNFRQLPGRKAIVLFTDGVDYHSDDSTFDGTLRGLDEEGVIVYPIRYDTRAQSERIAREQSGEGGLPTLDVIRRPAPGTTAPTFPSDDPDSGRTSSTRSRGILGLPSPDEIMRRQRRDDRREPNPDDGPLPPTRRDSRRPGSYPDPNDPRNDPTVGDPRRNDDSIGLMLNGLYSIADMYLKELAAKSGGRLLRADTLDSLPDAFAKIAAELRTQYSVGYYPTNKARDGLYRQVKVVISRKAAIIRARPGYRAPGVK
jgi:VWFA-related protein